MLFPRQLDIPDGVSHVQNCEYVFLIEFVLHFVKDDTEIISPNQIIISIIIFLNLVSSIGAE